MSNPSKRSVRYVYLLNPAREPEQEQMIYVPVDVWRDLLMMTGIGLFFGVGKGSNIDATGEVAAPLGDKDKHGLRLVERGPRNVQPPPDQAQTTSEPYPGIGLQQNPNGVDGVVALSKGEAEVIGKMLRVWAHLEASRAAMLRGGKALNSTRKRRHANEDEIEVGRAAQWTVPPYKAWQDVAQQLGEWLCVQTSSDVYIGMNPDALTQAVRHDMAPPDVFGVYPVRLDRPRAAEGFKPGGVPEPPPATADTKVLTMQATSWHGRKEMSHGGVVTLTHGLRRAEDGADMTVGLYTVERELIAELAHLGVVPSDSPDVVMLTTSDPAVIAELARLGVGFGRPGAP